ncbi:rhomboid family intramembrane serine protease [Streptomyces niger]|uniref:rhomboid family intramembrane serine protease n=1 Tax=Streptomyces niger TaxID=66373 RepID=UPI00069B827C|nr:rhomboid family intramembrane serine protease [Streptomyces niger]
MGPRAKPAALLVLAWVAMLWVLEAVDAASDHALDTFGIRPRELSELIDVIPATAVHFGFAHLMANTLPLLVLGFLAGLRSGVRRLAGVALLIAVVSGLGVWLISPPGSNTAGVSGVIFGLFGYLVVRGFIERKALDIAIGLLVAVLYGSILWGALPAAEGISWQAHLFGLAGGVLAAYVFRVRTPALRSPGRVP